MHHHNKHAGGGFHFNFNGLFDDMEDDDDFFNFGGSLFDDDNDDSFGSFNFDIGGDMFGDILGDDDMFGDFGSPKRHQKTKYSNNGGSHVRFSSSSFSSGRGKYRFVYLIESPFTAFIIKIKFEF